MDHVGFVVDDLQTATAFFVELGFNLGSRRHRRRRRHRASPRR
jgi:catechol 2,3-dioxygenase-like lactoylglutathione lyase family enzyme